MALLLWVQARTHEFRFNASLISANPDGEHVRDVIGINGQWPNPIIRVAKHDRVIIHLKNDMPDRNTSLHFHGLFMKDSNTMDGPESVTQCPIPPGHTFVYNFTVEQTGTYWYHSHLGAQYSDGLRGMFIIEEQSKEDYPFSFDEEVPLSVTDHYHLQSAEIIKSFKSRYNPTGAEPIPQNSLFNESRGVTWSVAPDTTYLLRIVNMGMFVSQYVYIEDHEFTIVEIDGVYVEPVTVDSLYIAVAQRYGVLLRTKKSPQHSTFRFVNVLDEPMLDLLPPDLKIISTNYLSYTPSAELPPHLPNGKNAFDKLIQTLHPVDDFNLKPVERPVLYDDADYQVVLNFTMNNLGNGVNYAFFNNISYVAPKIPTLYTVLSSGEFAQTPAIYGSNTNTFVLQKDEVVEIVLNNMDPGLHPFHLHGHTFQVISRSEGADDEDEPQIYDSLNPEHTRFPKHPMMRDTVVANANGFIVLRFKADNPGVWFFHCHVDWHLEQGLAVTFVEAPMDLQRNQRTIDKTHIAACHGLNIPVKGNAAAHYGDSKAEWLNLEGENVQPAPLPPGFTSKGYAALVACAFAAMFGVYSIYQYGIEDINTEEADDVVAKLYRILEEHDAPERNAMLVNNEPNHSI